MLHASVKIEITRFDPDGGGIPSISTLELVCISDSFNKADIYTAIARELDTEARAEGTKQ